MLGDDCPATLETKHGLAELYKEQARDEEAEKYLLEAIEGCNLKLGDKHPHTIESWNNLIDLYEAWNKPENQRVANKTTANRSYKRVTLSVRMAPISWPAAGQISLTWSVAKKTQHILILTTSNEI